MKIYRFSIFKSDQFGHGGEKRTAQISEILSKHGYTFEYVPLKTEKIHFLKFLKVAIYSFSLIIRSLFSLRIIPSIKFLKLFKKLTLKTYQINRINSGTLLLWEATRSEYAILVPLFKRKKLKIIALPHNLESLVPGQRSNLSNKKSPYWQFEEIRLLKACDSVLTISREENLLLNQCGVESNYLPYYPSEKVREFYLRIRGNRTGKALKIKNKQLLMLGSLNNPPTKYGMIDRITFFRNNPGICKLIVAGYYTQELKEIIPETGDITLLGEITIMELSKILSVIDAVLIHQPASSGSLTRIVELSIAGIPVICNPVSARNYYHLNNITIYHSDKELKKILTSYELNDSQDINVNNSPEILIDCISKFESELHGL